MDARIPLGDKRSYISRIIPSVMEKNCRDRTACFRIFLDQR